MGVDIGFDMVPPLSREAVDKKMWKSFIESIKNLFETDDLVETKPNYLIFKAGEHPRLPFEGHKFLSFRSKLTGNEGIDRYIDTVTRAARAVFGSRIHVWNDAADQLGYYDWAQVLASIKSYTQPDESGIPDSSARIGCETDPASVNELDLPLFEIRELPGKGKGLIARCNIAKGTRILVEKPLFTIRKVSSISQLDRNIATKLRALSKIEQRQFLMLHNNFPGKHAFSGVVRTNALPCGSNSVIGGVYPTICLINHSCLPNAHNSWNSDTERETIHAIRHIDEGEEITISYDKGGSSDSRRLALKAAFGFDCNCRICSLPLPELRISDARRLQIQHLDDAIGDADFVMKRPDQSLADCRSLLQVLEKEFHGYADGRTARTYSDAFEISITHGDQARASVFAERGYKSRVICEGEDSPVTRKMKVLMENPSSHMSFEITTRWRTAKARIPKELSTDEFERWLWRKGR